MAAKSLHTEPPADGKTLQTAQVLTYGMSAGTVVMAAILSLIGGKPTSWSQASPIVSGIAAVLLPTAGLAGSTLMWNAAVRRVKNECRAAPNDDAKRAAARMGYIGAIVHWLTPLEVAGTLAGLGAMLTGDLWLAAAALPAAGLMFLRFPNKPGFDAFVSDVTGTLDHRHIP